MEYCNAMMEAFISSMNPWDASATEKSHLRSFAALPHPRMNGQCLEGSKCVQNIRMLHGFSNDVFLPSQSLLFKKSLLGMLFCDEQGSHRSKYIGCAKTVILISNSDML